MDCPRPIKSVLPRFYPTWSLLTRPSMRIQRQRAWGRGYPFISLHLNTRTLNPSTPTYSGHMPAQWPHPPYLQHAHMLATPTLLAARPHAGHTHPTRSTPTCWPHPPNSQHAHMLATPTQLAARPHAGHTPNHLPNSSFCSVSCAVDHLRPVMTDADMTKTKPSTSKVVDL